MKAEKSNKAINITLTVINSIISIFSYLVFLFNQLCNLRFLGLWTAWNLSGYAYAFLVGPLSVFMSIISLIFVLSSNVSFNVKRINKFFWINAVFTIINILLTLSGWIIPGVFTWA